jgi:hypothetical protein
MIYKEEYIEYLINKSKSTNTDSITLEVINIFAKKFGYRDEGYRDILYRDIFNKIVPYMKNVINLVGEDILGYDEFVASKRDGKLKKLGI